MAQPGIAPYFTVRAIARNACWRRFRKCIHVISLTATDMWHACRLLAKAHDRHL